MSDFFKTRAGMQFVQGTMPRIADALERIADAMELAQAVAESKEEKEVVEETEN